MYVGDHEKIMKTKKYTGIEDSSIILNKWTMNAKVYKWLSEGVKIVINYRYIIEQLVISIGDQKIKKNKAQKIRIST